MERLFEAARKEPGPPPPFGFFARVLSALPREETKRPLLAELSLAFPRLAPLALALILLSFGLDWYLSQAETRSASQDFAALADQWLFSGAEP